jgi:hypothetical protein
MTIETSSMSTAAVQVIGGMLSRNCCRIAFINVTYQFSARGLASPNGPVASRQGDLSLELPGSSVRMIALALIAALAPATSASSADSRPLIRQAVDNYFRDAEAGRKMTFLRRRDYREYDGSGKLTERSLATRRIEFVDGVRVSWIVAENDKPLSLTFAVRGIRSS